MPIARILAAVLTIASPATLAAAPVSAASLSGSWSGGGRVHYGDSRERASCRARFSGSGSNYSMSASCATPSGRVDQSASVRKVGPNRYSGSFYNSQFGVSGSIRISVRGDSMSVSLSGGGGGGSLNLQRN